MGPVEVNCCNMSVFSQSFSPCGRFLAAGNNYGEIAIFSLSAALSPDATPSNKKPMLTFTAHEGPVFSLVSTDCHLISAGNGEVCLWNWAELIKKVRVGPKDNSLVIGAGDNNVHIMDLEHGVFKSVLKGHTDYIHCVCVRERESEILSGGEDGAVRIWDSRTGTVLSCISVFKYQECARPQLGKWISCLATDSDWMVCGGGPSLSLWHLRSQSPTSVFPLSNSQRSATFHQDMILAVGEGPHVSHCLLGGTIRAQIPSVLQSINTLQLNRNSSEHQVLTVGGSSECIDVFTNLSYRAFSLRF
uniref:THO complex 6 n=1 Tax=Cynoglossus semilaevis TaxID=244447 RepID=A0A3P8VCP0_CYNSE